MEWPGLRSALPADGKEEEEGDCDAHIAGLAAQIAHSMLEDDEEESKQGNTRNTSVLQQAKTAWSAQSIMAAPSCCNWDTIKAETLEAPSQLSLPLQQRIGNEAVELLYAELVRLKMEEKLKALAAAQQLSYHQAPFFNNAKQSTFQPLNHASEGFSQGISSSLKTAEKQHSFEILQNQQVCARKPAGNNWAAPTLHNRPSSSRGSKPKIGAPVDYPYSCYQQQPTNASGMRAVFLGMPGHRESGGTGVFLPRSRTGSHNNNALQSNRKPACSTVLLPSRIVQALNLNVEDTLSSPVPLPTINAPARRGFPSTAPTWCADAHFLNRSDSMEEWPPLQHPSCSPLQEVAPDISLPTEWTY